MSYPIDRFKEAPVLDESRVSEVLGEVLAERRRQHAKWGDQSALPDGLPHAHGFWAIEAADMKAYVKTAIGGQYLTWQALLREEVAEALAETDPAKLRAELVQVAAIAVQWIEAIDKRGGR